jgi:mRNA (guanine-N(7))-methyltransferase domain
MYDPARDIFTESQPSHSVQNVPHELSALDTLAGLAAQAEIAMPCLPETVSLAEKLEEQAFIPVRETQPLELLRVEGQTQSNGTAETIVDVSAADAPGQVEVAGTNEPEMSLKVTLHLKKSANKKMPSEDVQNDEEKSEGVRRTEDTVKEESTLEDDFAPPSESVKESSPPKLQSSPKQESPQNKGASTRQESPARRDDRPYPIPLSLAQLAKIPKRKAEDRREKDNLDNKRPNPNDDRNRSSDRQRRPRSRSPAYPPRSPLRRYSRTPPWGGQDDRYRPPLLDSYRPSRDREEYRYGPGPPPKRPPSPSPQRQLKRPVRRDVTAADRDRERRERQVRDEERQRREMESARARPVYETVRQHYNEREERGREARQESKTFRLRKFNNWVKSVLIAKFIPERTEEEVDEGRGLLVLDIGCGKGGDLGKWQKQTQVQGYVGVDIAEVSITHAEQRAAELRGRRFSTRFFALDCFVV